MAEFTTANKKSLFSIYSFETLFLVLCALEPRKKLYKHHLLHCLLAVKKLLRKRHQDEQILAWSSQVGVLAGNFALSFSLNFFSIFVHISGSILAITLIWASLERPFPPAEVEDTCRSCQFWSNVMTSEVEERPRFITAGYGRHKSQWVKTSKFYT